MHEAGIAHSVIRLAEHQIRDLGPVTIQRVGIRIGELAGVAPDALRFCFDCLKENTNLAGSELAIEWRSRYGCNCEITSPFVADDTVVCPNCSAELNLQEAEGLQLLYLDWEEVRTQ